MTFSSIQLRKEARPLLLPWITTMLVGVLSLFRFSRVDYFWSWSPMALLDWILPIGCFLAIPLLAAMPLGTEFQCGTFTALLAQPIERQKLWLQKTIMSFAAVLPPAALYLFSLGRSHEFDNDFWLAIVWIVASTAGSVAGTLLARSAIGGLALSSAFFGTLFVLWSKLAESSLDSGHFSPLFLSISIIVLFFYACALVWLGRRMFLRFQSIEGTHGANDLLGANHFLPRIAADWLRSKPRGAIANLIRREFHLLRTVWLLTLLSFVTWILLILFHLVRPNTSEFNRAPLPAGLAVILSLLIALLAGSLSLGEEKNSGTHSWQLTMPISPSTQWAVKLLFAVCASVLCAVAIPLGILITRGWISGSPYSYLDHTPLWVWFVEALVASLAAFWCSCVVKGTVRAVLLCFPMLVALSLAGAFGEWICRGATAQSLVDAVTRRFDPFRTSRFVTSVFGPPGQWWALGVVAPLLAVALIQSHRRFRAQTESSMLRLVRSMLPLLATVLFSTFLLSAASFAAQQFDAEQATIVREVHLAIETLETDGSRAGLPRLQELALDDLNKALPLSNATRRWLRGSTIVVQRQSIRPGGSWPAMQRPDERAILTDGVPGKQMVSYSATIRASQESECNLRFWVANGSKNGFLYYSCQ